MENRTGVWVLQHARERHHGFGSLRFAQSSLSNLHVEGAYSVDGFRSTFHERLPSDIIRLSATADQDLEAISDGPVPDHVLLLDGTWSGAKVLERANPWIADIPSFRISPPMPSRYRTRRQPSATCVSTLEAIVYALRVLEPNPLRLDALLTAFENMNAAQIRIVQTRGQRRKRHRKR